MAPFRYDIVGSFLRSERLKQARLAYEQEKISKEELRNIEDEEISKLMKKEKQVGLHAVSDGEYRRRYWHLDFLADLKGVKEVDATKWSVDFKGHQPKATTIQIVDKIDFENHPFLEDFKRANQLSEDTLCKMTIPSPTMLHLICCVRKEGYEPIDRYQNMDILYQDIAFAYQKAIRTFYDAGCRYLQLDDTSWGEFCDVEKRNIYKQRGIDVDQLQEKYVEMINLALLDKPKDMVVTMHICRGNFRSTWFSSGGYEPVAKVLFHNCHVDGFFLEYDSDRAGGFEPLRFVKQQKVVLGLISSKVAELEDKEQVKARIQEASKYVALSQLCLSTQCGFASTEEGNLLTEEEQWQKIAWVKEIAKEVWEDA